MTLRTLPATPEGGYLSNAPAELRDAIVEFFPPEEQESAAAIAYLESGNNAFALADTTSLDNPCGSFLRVAGGITITAERSVGYFQVNSCNFPNWEWQRLYNARHNAGTAHLIWQRAGWGAWYYSATRLGLI